MWRRFSIRQCLAVIAVIAVAMAIVTERWRWGLPSRVPYDKATAISWLSTVSQSDYRKYDREDVADLLADVCKARMLIGRTREQIEALLGPAEDQSTFLMLAKKNQVFYRIGLGRAGGFRSAWPDLSLRFDEDGKCQSNAGFFAAFGVNHSHH